MSAPVDSAAAAVATDSLLLARTLHDQGVVDLNARNFAAAESLLLDAFGLRTRLLGSHHPETAKTRLYIGILKQQTGRGAEADRDYLSAVDDLETGLGPLHPEYLWALNAYASWLQAHGHLEEARDAYETVLEGRRQSGSREDASHAWTLQNLAVIHQELTHFARAESLYGEAWRIRRAELGRHALTARSLASYGGIQFLRGSYLEARELLEEALDLLDETGQAKELDPGLCLLRLGLLHAWTGDAESAAGYLERARSILVSKGRPQDVAAVHEALGQTYLDTGRTREAEANHREALAIVSRSFPADSWRVGKARIDLAVSLAALNRTVEADTEFASGLLVLERSSPYHLGTALYEYGQDRLLRGDPGSARDAFARSLELSSAHLGEHHPHLVRCRIGLARALAGLGDGKAALDLALEAHELEIRHLDENIRYMTERHALLYGEDLERAEDLAIRIVASDGGTTRGDEARAWQAVVRGRARVLDELMARGREAKAMSPGERKAFRKLESARARLSNLYLRGRDGRVGEAYEKLLSAAVTEREEAEKEWASLLSQDRAPGGSAPELKRVLARLKPEDALVALVRYRDHLPERGRATSFSYGAFIGRAAGDVRFVRLGSATEVEKAVASLGAHMAAAPGRLRLAPAAALEDYLAIGRKLRRLAWDPVAAHLDGASRVLLVPEGPLHVVSFPALPLDGGGFLVEKEPLISLLTTERDLLRKRSRPGTRLLATGNPDFDASGSGGLLASGKGAAAETLRGHPADCDFMAALPFEPLPATAVEIDTVSRLWKGPGPSAEEVLVTTGPAASESSFRKLAPGRGIIHMATHAFFLADSCEQGGAASRPLFGLRCGLALAGANRTRSGREDDGILTGEEVAGLDLTQTGLVVLSACNTGQGDAADAEGVFGLRRAFTVAGAQTLVMSLWPVADRSTAEWMGAFYRGLSRSGAGWSVARATREASRKLLEARRHDGKSIHPFHWGAFISVGDAE